MRSICEFRVPLYFFSADRYIDGSFFCAADLHLPNAGASASKRGKLMRRFSPGRMAEESGATLVEFAVTLPLLVVVLYAVFDFGSVYSLKQKLGSAVYECARAGASQSPGN